jgi:hypothetical protein
MGARIQRSPTLPLERARHFVDALLYGNGVLIETAAACADAGEAPSAVEANNVKYFATGKPPAAPPSD